MTERRPQNTETCLIWTQLNAAVLQALRPGRSLPPGIEQLKLFTDGPIYHLQGYIVQISVPQLNVPPGVSEEQLRRRNRLMTIIEMGIPPFPHTVVELTTILSSASADVRKAAKLIRTDPSLSAQVLRLCNSPLFGLRSRVISIEQAATLLGTDRLRSLTMTSSLVDLASHGLPKDQVTSFWKHSFLAAMLSQHLAQYREYREKEQAYIAGLLHDIGQVPHWMLTTEEKRLTQGELPENWLDNTSVERRYFGMDHCEVGSRMAKSWNFMPSFVDVLVSHHEPAEAQHDPYLVQIVAAVEHYLLAKEQSVLATEGDAHTPDQPRPSETERSRQPFAEEDWLSIVEKLDNEYNRLLPLVDRGLPSVLGAAT